MAGFVACIPQQQLWDRVEANDVVFADYCGQKERGAEKTMVFASRIACWIFLDSVMQTTSKLAWLRLGLDQCWACLCWLLRGPCLASLLVLGLGDSGPWWGGLLPLRAPPPTLGGGGGTAGPWARAHIYIYIEIYSLFEDYSNI